jgi:hypothetical protein
VVGCCDRGDGPSGSGATELAHIHPASHFICRVYSRKFEEPCNASLSFRVLH